MDSQCRTRCCFVKTLQRRNTWNVCGSLAPNVCFFSFFTMFFHTRHYVFRHCTVKKKKTCDGVVAFLWAWNTRWKVFVCMESRKHNRPKVLQGLRWICIYYRSSFLVCFMIVLIHALWISFLVFLCTLASQFCTQNRPPRTIATFAVTLENL